MTAISVIPNTQNLERFSVQVLQFVQAKARSRAAQIAINSILAATRSGVDAYGEMFVPYRPRTVKERQRLGLRTDIVNLYVTGAMLASLGANGNPDGTVTFSESQLEKAINNLFLGRDFIGPGPFMLEAVKEDLELEVKSLV